MTLRSTSRGSPRSAKICPAQGPAVTTRRGASYRPRFVRMVTPRPNVSPRPTRSSKCRSAPGPAAAPRGAPLPGAVHPPAGRDQQRRPRLSLKITPQRVGSLDQGDIGWIFEVGLPDDAGPAVRGAAVMGGGELLEAQHPEAAAGEVMRRGAPHRAQAQNNYVIDRHRLAPGS